MKVFEWKVVPRARLGSSLPLMVEKPLFRILESCADLRVDIDSISPLYVTQDKLDQTEEGKSWCLVRTMWEKK